MSERQQEGTAPDRAEPGGPAEAADLPDAGRPRSWRAMADAVSALVILSSAGGLLALMVQLAEREDAMAHKVSRAVMEQRHRAYLEERDEALREVDRRIAELEKRLRGAATSWEQRSVQMDLDGARGRRRELMRGDVVRCKVSPDDPLAR